MPKVATGFYAVCKGREVGVFTTWDEAQPHIQGFPGAKFKKFKSQPEAEQWYRSNLPQRPSNPQTKTATPATLTAPPPAIIFTSPSSSRATYVQPNPSTASALIPTLFISKPSMSNSKPPTSVSKPALVSPSKALPQPVHKAVTTSTPVPAHPPRIAAPKNTTVDIVYSDGACKGNGTPRAVGGIGVWWGPDDPRNLSERCPGAQTNNRAELIAIARVLETVPLSSNTLIIRTDSQYSKKALTEWSFNWRKNGWRTSGGVSVLNKELIDYTLTLLETRQRAGQPVSLEYVKGHSGDVGNDGADALAVAGCDFTEKPDRDWVKLKNAYVPGQDVMDVDPVGSASSDKNLNSLKPFPQSVSTATITPTPGPSHLPRIAAPKNTTVNIVYSDGACRGNGSPNAVGGVGVWWGPDDPRNISERCPGQQTNNRAELIAIARVLETVPPSSNSLIIRTDSQYSKKALTEWAFNWRKNGWRTSGGGPVSNKELIDYTLTLLETRQRAGQPVNIEYVKGHSGNVGNDGADALAVAGCDLPEEPERDWVKLKKASAAEQDLMDLLDIDPADFLLSDEDLMRELEDDY